MTRLESLLRAAAELAPPPADLATELCPRPDGPVSAVLGFTGHHVVAADVDHEWFDAARDRADFASVMRAPFLAALGAAIGARVGHLDVVLVAARGSNATPAPVDALELAAIDPAGADHARIRRALTYRHDVRAHQTGDRSGVVMMGRGLAGRWEVSFEVEPGARGRGVGTALAAAAVGLVPPDEPVFAQVSPGNVASLLVLLRAGYRPIGSEVLLLHPG